MLPPELQRADLPETALVHADGRPVSAAALECWAQYYLESGQAAEDYAERLAKQMWELVEYGEGRMP